MDTSVYVYPCIPCGNPANQIESSVNFLKTNNLQIRIMWLDIEAPDEWFDTIEENQDFFNSLVETAQNLGNGFSKFCVRFMFHTNLQVYQLVCILA